jgi:hypothetical protein
MKKKREKHVLGERSERISLLIKLTAKEDKSVS